MAAAFGKGASALVDVGMIGGQIGKGALAEEEKVEVVVGGGIKEGWPGVGEARFAEAIAGLQGGGEVGGVIGPVGESYRAIEDEVEAGTDLAAAEQGGAALDAQAGEAVRELTSTGVVERGKEGMVMEEAASQGVAVEGGDAVGEIGELLGEGVKGLGAQLKALASRGAAKGDLGGRPKAQEMVDAQ